MQSESKIENSTADWGDKDNFIAVAEDGVGGDKLEVDAEAGEVSPLFEFGVLGEDAIAQLRNGAFWG